MSVRVSGLASSERLSWPEGGRQRGREGKRLYEHLALLHQSGYLRGWGKGKGMVCKHMGIWPCFIRAVILKGWGKGKGMSSEHMVTMLSQ